MRPSHIFTTAVLLAIGTTISEPATAVVDRLALCASEKFGPDARCGTLTVAEDRTRPEGRSIDLNVVVLPATGSDTKEPLFLLAGGPGQGATDLIELALGPFTPVREVRDMVLVDQRGTGSSNRIDCPVNGSEVPGDVFGDLFDPTHIGECLQEVKQRADPTLYASNQVVDDLDTVRKWLGYEDVLLWGGSGGTRTALIWMRRHPERVVGALLDGVAPSNFKAPSTMARGCQESLDKMFAECQTQEDCRSAFPGLEAEFDKLMELFAEGPVATHIVDLHGNQVPIEMHRGDFTYAVRGLIYRRRSLAKLPAMIHQAARTDDIQPFAQAYWQRQVGLRPHLAMGVHFSVYCSEDLPFIAEDEVAGFTDNTFVGRYLYDQYLGACQQWAAVPVDESFLQPVESDIPVLIISGYYDPSTPAALGEQIATHLPNSRHVIARNESHGAEFGCALPAAVQFLTTGSLDDLGPICDDAGPIVYEVSL